MYELIMNEWINLCCRATVLYRQVSKPNSKAFRSAAVQTIAHNGSHQDAVDLMTQVSAARYRCSHI